MDVREDSFKMNVKRNGVGRRDSPGLRLHFVVGLSDCRDEPSCFAQNGEFVDELRDCWLLKNGPAPHSELISWQIRAFHSGAGEKLLWNTTPCSFLSSYGLNEAVASACLQNGGL
jgi:hypothetical protein